MLVRTSITYLTTTKAFLALTDKHNLKSPILINSKYVNAEALRQPWLFSCSSAPKPAVDVCFANTYMLRCGHSGHYSILALSLAKIWNILTTLREHPPTREMPDLSIRPWFWHTESPNPDAQPLRRSGSHIRHSRYLVVP